MTNEEFELLGEPRMTVAQFWIEEQLAEQEAEMSEHTKGPWKAHTIISKGGYNRSEIRDKDDEPIATAWDEDSARLIAAAPELLEALRELSDPMAYEHIGKFHGRKRPWNIAREAIAKAEGR